MPVVGLLLIKKPVIRHHGLFCGKTAYIMGDSVDHHSDEVFSTTFDVSAGVFCSVVTLGLRLGM